MAIDHQAFFDRMATAMSGLDFAAFEALLTDDCVTEYPQSGEIIRGRANLRATLENYPSGLPQGGFDRSSLRIAAGDEKWVATPMFTVVRVEGSGNVGTAMFRVGYPDGSTWWAIVLYELRGDQLARSTQFFAPMFEAPAWRAPYVDQAASGR